jgi:hypothetical protein
LSLHQVDMADYSFSKHFWFLLLLESHSWARCSVVLPVINCNVKLQLNILRRECNGLALGASWRMLWKEDIGGVCRACVIKRREDLDICERSY